MDSITESASTEMKTYKEGELIKGKDFIRLESPLVLLSKKTPLLTEAQDVAGAINELFQSGTGAANGSFRAVLDDNAGLLKIIVQEGEKYADHEFAYETFDFSDSITTKTTSGDTVTTTTRKFSKRIITSLTDSSGAVLLLTKYDADSGEILGYTDGSDEVVYTSEWRTEYEITETQSQGASSAAVAWCIARNLEQSNGLEIQKNAYRQGVVDYSDEVVTEEWETTDKEFTILPDGSSPALTDLEANGFTSYYEDKNSGEIIKIRIYIAASYYKEDYTDDGVISRKDRGDVRIEITEPDGTSYYTSLINLYSEIYTRGVLGRVLEFSKLNVTCSDGAICVKYEYWESSYNRDGSLNWKLGRVHTYTYTSLIANCKYVYTSNF